MEPATPTCSSCGTPRAAGKKFCGECGTALPPVCPSCSAVAIEQQKFCDECGTALQGVASPRQTGTEVRSRPSSPPQQPVASAVPRASAASPFLPAEERRLVTALFCDLVGFTPLSEQLDPEEVRDIQADYFGRMAEQIERYGGTVEKYAGDAVLALFGAPVAHEDDAERAVLCALGMQGAIEPVAAAARSRWNVDPSIRVGVNTGEVVSGTWSASGRQDVAVTGDAVNTAARIQAAGEPGEVLAGTETMRLTHRIRYGEKREVVLKGKLGSVPVYPALGLRERFGERWETSEEATPLIGRDREMVQLLDSWVRARGGEGQLVTVVGDAGVGKSRLVAEVIDKLTANSAVRVVRARCLSYGQEIALWLVADFLRSLFGVGESDGLPETRTKLASAVPSLLAQHDPETRTEALDVLGEVLGVPPGNSLVAGADAQIRRQALIRSLKLLLGAVSERAPTVLVLEDMHWADTSSQEVLKEILSHVPGLRLLALVAQRPGWMAPWGEWGWTERITLRPLGQADAARLAGAVLGGIPLTPILEGYIAERAGGNPFFVEELLRGLQETNECTMRHGAMCLAPGAAERLPSTLTEILLARLDRLEVGTRQVAQVASVIGTNFPVRLLAQVMEREGPTLEVPLSALQQAEIAFPRSGADLEYVFKHVTMREVAYNTLVQKRRQRLHLDTARAMATLYPSDEYVEIIAHHYSKTGEHEEAAEWLERAGDRAAAIDANDTAITNYGEAHRRQELNSGAPTALARLDEKLGEALNTVGRDDDAIPVLERAVRLYRENRDLEGAGRAAAWLGRALSKRGTPQEALSRVEPMVELLTPYGPSPALASLHLALAIIFHTLGRYEEMQVAAERAEEIAEAVGDERLLARAMERRGSALSLLGRIDEARPVLEEVIRLLERVGDLERLTVALSNLGEVYRLLGELAQARYFNDRALETAERVGNPARVAFCVMNLAQILFSLGAWGEAEEYLERAGEVLAALPSASSTAPYIPAMLGQIVLAGGGWEDAATALERALGMAAASDNRQALETVHTSLAELEILRGEPEAAIIRLEPLAGREGGSRVLIETTLAWAFLETGEARRAGTLVGETLQRGRAQGEKLALVDALRVQGMVLTRLGRKDEAVATLEEGLDLAQSLPYPYAEARILERLGRTDEALAVFRRLGAQKDIERTEGELATLARWPGQAR